MPRFSANLGLLFPDRPLIERFAAAAAAGFKAVETQTPFEAPAAAVKAELDRLGLTMLAINTTMGRPGDTGLAAVPGREREFAAAIDQALDYVVAIGGTGIHCVAGVVPPEQRPAAEKTMIANMTAAADKAAKANITLLLEPLNRVDRPDFFLAYVEQAADLIGKIGRTNVKLQYDFYHVQIMQGDLIRRFQRLMPIIGHVQAASVPKRTEPDEGEINYPEVFKAVDAAGYTGWIGAEYNPRGRTEDGLGWAREYGVVPRG